METTEEQNIMSLIKAVNKVPLKCDSCEFSTFWPRSLECHRMIHTRKNLYLYKCKQCNFSTRHKSSLRRHDRKHHFDFIATMTIADNEILEFLSQNLIPTLQPCNQNNNGSSIRDIINYTGKADNTENRRNSSYTNYNFQHGIGSTAVTSSSYQDEVSSSFVSKHGQTGTSNIINSTIALNNYQGGSCFINDINNFQNGISSSVGKNKFQNEIGSNFVSNNFGSVISSSVDSNNYQGKSSSLFNNNVDNFQNGISSSFINNNNCSNELTSSTFSTNFRHGISSSYINNNFQNGISSRVGNQNCQSEIRSNFVRKSCNTVISSSVVSNNYQRTSSSFFNFNDNNFHKGISSNFINNNNCVNGVTSSTFSNNFQNGISSISATSNYENVISGSVVSSNCQNARRNSDSFVRNMSTNNVENFDETLSTESLSRPKPSSVGNELSPGNNLIVFVCELCDFECSSADVCYNHAAEHQTNVFRPPWVAACANVL